ncbi:FtsX-like permease family protein [Cellulomonas sp. H30R-01]|uniref:FtsX-like permease family protein n=1 Tax=Cellulomonas sp. H30R-01 TaxID=2704467 RepID=UPI00138C60E1|nr:FtsX-like permease family protein [Cellulomonas sp. H30R-01]QHT56349.1 FtsX-like permease family protein [Cellulomonas sp. H30R-01]
MLRLTLAQMRRSVGRLTAAAVAIAIGTAFLAATLVAGNVLQRTGYDSVTAQFGDADLVVTSGAAVQDLDTVRDVPGVFAADPLLLGGAELSNGARTTYQMLLAQPGDERLASVVAPTGRVPAAAGEVALPATTLDRLDAAVGDTLEVRWSSPSDDGEWTEHEGDVTVVGLADDPAGAWSAYGGAGLATTSDVLEWSGEAAQDSVPAQILVVTDGSSQVQADVTTALDDADVLTKREAAEAAVEQITGSGNALVMVVLGFAAVALLVAALVIANTFQVLVAQRARTLALLRCVGAVKRQLRLSVLFEATVLGIAASVGGVVLGLGLAQAALAVLARADTGTPLPSTIAVTPTVVLVPLLVGTLVTAVASLVPAREATRVSPVAALRPVDAPSVSARGGRVRLALSLLLLLGGAAGLLVAVAASAAQVGEPVLLLGLGVLGGALSFVGVLLGAVFWIPRVVSLAGRALATTGTSARLAAANTLRNPRRTATTSTALLIGVTLVVLMSTGAASARRSITAGLEDHYPVDVAISAVGGAGDESVPASVVAEVADVPGVEQVVEVPTASVVLGDGTFVVLRAPDPAEAAAVLRDADALDRLEDGTVVLPAAREDTVTEGDTTVEAVGTDGEPTGESATLRAVHSSLGGVDAVVTPATLRGLVGDAPVQTLWVRLDPDVDAATTALAINDAVSSDAVLVESAGAERQQYENLIDDLLAVVVGLLGVAVVIAVVGVANTLSLSVIERRRESATLRAIGMSRRQLRWMLAYEGMLIAGMGAVLGTLLGLLYGWAGAAIILAGMGEMQLALPWDDLLMVLAVALAAGLLASVLPGRSAARTSPVAALAVD